MSIFLFLKNDKRKKLQFLKKKKQKTKKPKTKSRKKIFKEKKIDIIFITVKI